MTEARSPHFASRELPTPDPPETPDAAREDASGEMSRESARLAALRAYARRLAADAPPFSPAQRAELHAIFSAAQQRNAKE